MTIHPRPDQERQIEEALRTGLIRNPEEVIDAGLEHLRERSTPPAARSPQSLRDVFESVRGLADGLDFSRNPSTGRPVDLA
jgi:hypothetical protein